MLSVVLIGAGNVASHLYKALEKAKDITVLQWYNRNLKTIESYRNKVSITNNLADLKTADIYIIAVSDDVIGALSSQLPFSNQLVVHTSGSVSLHDLDKKNRRGVFYPLQTFTKDADIDFTEVPICIEIEDKNDLQLLKELSKALGCKHYRVNSDQRAALHLAAVFVNNFTNQLYRIGHEITESKSVDFNILKPLIKETANKIELLSPYMAQTGPAKRGDKKTIKKHLKTLDKDIHKDIYELLTKSIKQTHGKKL
ncbi:Rossmann-like and DUF2520 domain-containing protein [Pontimicrobium sp. SW4]|uniref:Rossmann-like and DUF2520 domain-containing protein n=1 Tax=Pontimicrobium sp. SW4 TaxID=3153519 RepID=A0AAU7BW69_9FLAO